MCGRGCCRGAGFLAWVSGDLLGDTNSRGSWWAKCGADTGGLPGCGRAEGTGERGPPRGLSAGKPVPLPASPSQSVSPPPGLEVLSPAPQPPEDAMQKVDSDPDPPDQAPSIQPGPRGPLQRPRPTRPAGYLCFLSAGGNESDTHKTSSINKC